MLEIAKRSYNNRAKNILFCHILLTGIRDETSESPSPRDNRLLPTYINDAH